MLFRFRIDLSDVDRGVYETLDFRVALHPSETAVYLFTRVLAYALSWEEGLEFSSGGLSDPDSPALQITSPHGKTRLWIEIGNPSSRKLHKASKASEKVKVYTYKDPEVMVREAKGASVHRADEIEIYAFPEKFLDQISKNLEKDTRMNLLLQDRQLTVDVGSTQAVCEIVGIKLEAK